MPILKADLKAPNMEEEADDPEQSEYLARVRWLYTRSREQAVWEKGMFANQNVVAKLRQPFTLQRLAEVFRVPADEILGSQAVFPPTQRISAWRLRHLPPARAPAERRTSRPAAPRAASPPFHPPNPR